MNHVALRLLIITLIMLTIASGSYDCIIKIWNLNDSSCIQTIYCDELIRLLKLVDNKTLMSVGIKNIKMWSLI